MGRLRTKSDYEDARNARILENQARLASIGIHRAISDIRSITSTAKPVKTHVRKYHSVDYERTSLRSSNRLKQISAHSTPEQTPLRRSTRLRGISANLMIYSAKDNEESSLTLFSEGEEKRPSNAPLVSDYEDLRNARILENQARLVSLGVHKAISDLRSVTLTSKPVRKSCKVNYERTPLRRSNRLKRINAHSTPEQTPLGRSTRLRGISANLMISSAKENEESSLTWFSEGDEKRPANAPLVGLSGTKLLQLSPEVSARRCTSKGRGSVYDPVFGICCHFCRQKKLCGEEDCKRCSNLDTDQPCMGKTDCSVCHSSNGVFCRACLEVRYGEDIEEVRGNAQWMCPHCIEDKGLNPYWICNSSICLKKRKMASTGIAIYKAREMGFKSVAHLLMDELQRAGKWR